MSGSQVGWGRAWPKCSVAACVACDVVGRLRCQMRRQKCCIAVRASAVMVVTVVVVVLVLVVVVVAYGGALLSCRWRVLVVLVDLIHW